MTTLHSIVSGNETSEKTVVLLPSIGTTHEAWEPQLPALEADYRVVRIDHRGHGDSPTPAVDAGTTSVDDLAKDVLETLSSLGIERCTIVGLSMGGAIAQYLAATSDRIERAVFASTATFLGGAGKWHQRSATARNEGMSPIVDPTVDNWFTEGFKESSPEVVDKFKAMVGSVDPEAYAQCGDALAKWGFDDRLQEITVPVLTIAGAEDPSTGPKQLQEIAAGVTGEAQCVTIESASHQVATEQAGKFSEALLAFLEK
ncbi:MULTISPECIES: alpha/beta fold hydrolase [unclassified Corynebacterium]|uniref:alpha/beta fold hydrolase n=1 Tax=unclassified Corynebacterium TaxID=2624378 RepID=UPI0026548BB5|nr:MULTISPECIES: alpha/beta hydrolase [unclassified Corynebacterium]MDN8594601.1 alpha/beta hydrolase [Corynebacterium sp. P4_F2]WKK55556.1 alpha/beta hydrolase [Corynebacterium sp. P4-C1]WKK62966.1 alpha/beta hydrolase [Corynebacterium sp. P8-C1]